MLFQRNNFELEVKISKIILHPLRAHGLQLMLFEGEPLLNWLYVIFIYHHKSFSHLIYTCNCCGSTVSNIYSRLGAFSHGAVVEFSFSVVQLVKNSMFVCFWLHDRH